MSPEAVIHRVRQAKGQSYFPLFLDILDDTHTKLKSFIYLYNIMHIPNKRLEKRLCYITRQGTF